MLAANKAPKTCGRLRNKGKGAMTPIGTHSIIPAMLPDISTRSVTASRAAPGSLDLAARLYLW